jgi:hypothetical protein
MTALLTLLLLTPAGPIYQTAIPVPRARCAAIAAAVRVPERAVYRGWSVRVSCGEVRVLPGAAEGLGH